MAISEAFTGTETVGSTEWSMVTDTSGPDAETADGVYQVFLDLSALAAGDVFEVRGYEKVLSAGTQRQFMKVTLADAQTDPHWVSPSFILLHGWDFTLKKVTGTDRSINWSIRKVA